jgi:hypothetical protein
VGLATDLLQQASAVRSCEGPRLPTGGDPQGSSPPPSAYTIFSDLSVCRCYIVRTMQQNPITVAGPVLRREVSHSGLTVIAVRSDQQEPLCVCGLRRAAGKRFPSNKEPKAPGLCSAATSHSQGYLNDCTPSIISIPA